MLKGRKWNSKCKNHTSEDVKNATAEVNRVCGVAAFIGQNSQWSSGTCYHLKSPPGYINCKCFSCGANVNGLAVKAHVPSLSAWIPAMKIEWLRSPNIHTRTDEYNSINNRIHTFIIYWCKSKYNIFFQYLFHHHGSHCIYMICLESDTKERYDLISLVLNHM